MAADKQEILDCLKGMREICALSFKVVNLYNKVVTFEEDLRRVQLEVGHKPYAIMERCQALIEKLEADLETK
jgi:hypothetical protein